MEKKKEIKLNDNGTYTTKEIIETTPDDGFVMEKDMRPIDRSRKFHKGYSKNIVYTTNDPKIIRPFLYGICGIVFIIGIIMLLLGEWFLGIPFLVLSIVCFVKEKKVLDKKALELQPKGSDTSINSKLEKEQLKNKSANTLKKDLKDLKDTTFTKDRYKWFLKTSLPFYCVLSIIIVILISIFISMSLGLFIFIILVLSGFLFYYLISKLFKE